MSLVLPYQLNTTDPLTLPQVNPTQLSWIDEPDIRSCQEFYGRLDESLDINDCRAAIDNLPTGNVPLIYRPLRPYGRRDQPPNLLVLKTVGTCQLKAFASGQWAEQSEFAINIVPNDIRDMFEEAMGCLYITELGGFVTKHLARTIDWLLSADTVFPQRPNIGYMPPSITFLSAMIWDSSHNTAFYDPGANSWVISAVLMYALEKAYKDLFQREGPGSLLGRKLKRGWDFISTIFNDHQSIEREPYWTWWGAQRPQGPPGLDDIAAILGNLTSGDDDAVTELQSNITSVSLGPNVTILDFSNDTAAAELNNDDVKSAPDLTLNLTASTGPGSSETSHSGLTGQS